MGIQEAFKAEIFSSNLPIDSHYINKPLVLLNIP